MDASNGCGSVVGDGTAVEEDDDDIVLVSTLLLLFCRLLYQHFEIQKNRLRARYEQKYNICTSSNDVSFGNYNNTNNKITKIKKLERTGSKKTLNAKQARNNTTSRHNRNENS